jgi:NAD+ synthase
MERITLDDILNIDYGHVEKKIEEFLEETLRSAGARGYVIGLSGGVDSSASVSLAVKAVGKDRVLGLIMPDHEVTPQEDIDDAKALAKLLGIKFHVIDITPTVKTFSSSIPIFEDEEKDKLPLGNLRVRIRMCLLYYYANKLNYLVLGTTDRSEWYIGYFTKYGDGAVDVEPIIILYKSQVRRLALHLGVPEKIALKPSSPRMWPGHTAEGELGVSYNDIDIVLYALHDLGLKPEEIPQATGVSEKVVARVLELERSNKHKREPPLRPSLEVVKEAYRKGK